MPPIFRSVELTDFFWGANNDQSAGSPRGRPPACLQNTSVPRRCFADGLVRFGMWPTLYSIDVATRRSWSWYYVPLRTAASIPKSHVSRCTGRQERWAGGVVGRRAAESLVACGLVSVSDVRHSLST